MLKHLCLQIIHVNLTQENVKPLESGRILDLTYSVKWTLTNVSFARRFDVYLDYPFFEHQVKSNVGSILCFSFIAILDLQRIISSTKAFQLFVGSFVV